MSKVHMLQMTRNQDVATALYAFLEDKQWAGVVILGGIGSVSSMTVANPVDHDSPPKIAVNRIDEPLEVLGFTGELFAKGAEPDNMPAFASDNPSHFVVHIHVTVSHGDGSVTGGGFRDATVMRGLNLYMMELSSPFQAGTSRR
ncbi:MAG: DNA-binding protein [Pseudomonadales bacterium]|nr:DNA-binding protein [Pseudomonadales bacterium]